MRRKVRDRRRTEAVDRDGPKQGNILDLGARKRRDADYKSRLVRIEHDHPLYARRLLVFKKSTKLRMSVER